MKQNIIIRTKNPEWFSLGDIDPVTQKVEYGKLIPTESLKKLMSGELKFIKTEIIVPKMEQVNPVPSKEVLRSTCELCQERLRDDENEVCRMCCAREAQ